MKKAWENASVEELVIEATAGGGMNSEVHDGVWIRDEDNKKWEGVFPDSAQ